MADDSELALLREIRVNQREALQVHREHMHPYQQQLARIERIDDQAEAIQGRAGRAAKFIVWIAIPLLSLLLALMPWPYLHNLVA